MDHTAETVRVIVRPPLAWGLAVIAGLALGWLVPLRFVPVDLHGGWLGAAVFVLALGLFGWAVVTMTRAGSHVPSNRPTTTIVDTGPYRFTRNPIYLGFLLIYLGITLLVGTLWGLLLSPFLIWTATRLIIHAEEDYLGSKFADEYRAYCSRVHRWV